ncbi:hypothetical protein I79_022590 [Cricetulus griseus]|uniref:Uncharacterized protein n=1 Tax=Cricetulus griseus TaxID=10029 RepID=G3IFR7_CRIGR|nr:hypothetical protein I79_022590 [Cricetulus griseus]
MQYNWTSGKEVGPEMSRSLGSVIARSLEVGMLLILGPERTSLHSKNFVYQPSIL